MPSPERFFFSLDSEMWRINHQKWGLIFGPAAAILQVAHPRIAQGVADHSTFPADSLGRLKRTLVATNTIAFGTAAEAEAMRRRLDRVHRGVNGEVSAGIGGPKRYSATEPDLLLWVLATMIEAALSGYEFIEGTLEETRKATFYADMRRFGEVFGLDRSYGPQDYPTFRTYYAEMIEGDLLGSHPLCSRLARAIATPADSPPAKIIGSTVTFLPRETLPDRLRDRLGLKSTALSRASMRIFAAAAPLFLPRLPERFRIHPEALDRLKRERRCAA